MNKKFGRGSIVVFIVGFAVGLSAVLAIIKAVKIFDQVEDHPYEKNPLEHVDEKKYLSR